jgi:acyl carrier protein
MDAFVSEQNRASDTPWISVNWEGWQTSDVAAEFGGTHALAMTHDEGVRTFNRLLARPELETVIISTSDLPARIAHWTRCRPSSDSLERASAGATEQHDRPNISSLFKAPESDAEIAVAAIWEELLGIRGIGVEDNFFELGGDSLLATRVMPRLRDAFGIDIQLRDLFEKATVVALAAKVEEILIEQIDALSDEEAERLVDSAQSKVDSKGD